MLHEMVIGTKLHLDEHAALMLKFPDMEHDESDLDTPSCGGRKNPCNAMLVAKNGTASVYQKYEGNHL